ncbi:MAG: glycine--tRNA ligase subunit beta [Gammaproteobacteria bacterium]|nr:glycine--tRNA ligase subunit beta [Gammaproteobacteria bacterium]
MNTLLIELGCEDLPAGPLQAMVQYLGDTLRQQLTDAGLSVGDVTLYATPRRIACSLHNVGEKTPERQSERRGPAVQAAYDGEGNPSKAALGFAASCGVEFSQLETLETDKGAWLVHRSTVPGQTLDQVLASALPQVIDSMPLPKRMRWASHDHGFLRPVRWLIAMHGSRVIDVTLLGLKAANITFGHRFHAPEPIELESADNYAEVLSGAYVIADMHARRQAVVIAAEKAAQTLGVTPKMDDDLIDEINCLVEWPVAVSGHFDESFLTVPKETLIQTMQDNQRYFPLFNADGSLYNGFITIANIESEDEEQVRLGNERVVTPRLADAKFFWDQDRKKPLAHQLEGLRKVVFQEKLGTLYDKTERLVRMTRHIAQQLGVDNVLVERAAWMAKCDLLTEMVYEFPELQGIAGKYYLHGEGESIAVAEALEQQYWPKQAGTEIAKGAVAQCLAIADKIDTLAGIFAIGQKPTGTKDPFALRRNSLGLLRTLIEGNLDLDIEDLLRESASTHAVKLGNADAAMDALPYVLERLTGYYADQGISRSVVDAVLSKGVTRPVDIDQRIKAVAAFSQTEAASSLAEANKRAGNILRKNADEMGEGPIDTAKLEDPAEIALHTALTDVTANVQAAERYSDALNQLAGLRQPVDDFFTDVMVMADDPALRQNRLKLVAMVYDVCNGVAELAKL